MNNKVDYITTDGIDYILDTDVLVKKIVAAGEYRLVGEELDLFLKCTEALTKADKYRYTNRPLENTIYKLNGTYFEHCVDAETIFERHSSGVFSTKCNYDPAGDFIRPAFSDKFGRTTGVTEVEAKNCLNKTSFNMVKGHNKLYVLLNSREDRCFHLLCRLSAGANENGLEVLQDKLGNRYKIIKPWFTLDNLKGNYKEKYSLQNSFRIIDHTLTLEGDEPYIVILSPHVSNTSSVSVDVVL